jgi:hypothetical protein
VGHKSTSLLFILQLVACVDAGALYADLRKQGAEVIEVGEVIQQDEHSYTETRNYWFGPQTRATRTLAGAHSNTECSRQEIKNPKKAIANRRLAFP